MRPGRSNRYVELSRSPQTTPDSDGFFETLTPARMWAQVEPLDPVVSDGTRITAYRVTMRYHAQVTVDTRLVDLHTGRELFVKGVQNTDDANKELRLYCEEITA